MSKRDEIIDAAIKEFAQYSYDAASINRIIKESGTSKGTFYHYFKDKKALYFAIIEDTLRIKQEYFARMSEYMKKENSDFFNMMKAQAKAAMLFMQERPDLYKFGLKFATEQQPLKDEFSQKYLPGVQDTFKKIVESDAAVNSFSKRYPAEFAVRIILYMSMNYFDILFDKGEKPSMEEIERSLDMMYDFLKRGLS